VDARQAVAVATEIGDSSGLASALAALADALADLGSHAQAVEAGCQALQILESIGGPQMPALQRRLVATYAASVRRS
jgi:hypothetical protein